MEEPSYIHRMMPTMNSTQAISKVSCSRLFFTARIATASASLIERSVTTTLHKALAHKVGAITSVTGIATMLGAKI